MYRLVRGLVFALIAGSITNECFVLLRSSAQLPLEIFSQQTSDGVSRSRARDATSEVMVGKATRFDDHPASKSADVYGNGWLKVLQSIGTEKNNRQLLSTKLPIVELNSSTDKKEENAIEDDDSVNELQVEVEEIKEYVPKKSRGTIRSDVYTALREIKEQINKGEKDAALQLLVSKAEQLDFNSLEINFAATKVKKKKEKYHHLI